jgi:hypothetical protein
MSWEGKVATLADRYMKGAEDLTVRSRLVPKWLNQQGRIVTNCDAEYAYFSVLKSEPPVEGYAEAGIINFGRRNLWDQAKLGWRGYVATDMMYKHERMQAKGDVVIVNRYAEIMEHLTSATRNKIHKHLYIDGNASGNESFIQGLNTFCGTGTTGAADKVAQPSDTYFDISTAVGQDGTWTSNLGTSPNSTIATDWPNGEGDPEYDYWTPKLVNTTGTGFGASTWEENCETGLRQLLSWLTLLNDTSGQELLCVMDGLMFTQLKDKFSARNRQLMPHPVGRDLGFPQVLNFEGLALHSEFGIPSNTGFVWNLEKTELCSLAPKLLFKHGPEFSIEKLAWLFLIGFYGNLRVKSPKYFAKLYPYA